MLTLTLTLPLNPEPYLDDLVPFCSALAEDMGELPAAEVVRLGGEMKDTALVPVRAAPNPDCKPCQKHACAPLAYRWEDTALNRCAAQMSYILVSRSLTGCDQTLFLPHFPVWYRHDPRQPGIANVADLLVCTL